MGGSNAKIQTFHKAIAEDDNEAAVRIALEDDDSLVNSRGEGGKTALHIAVCHGSLKVLTMLLRNESLDASIATVARETSLILSASHNQEEIALKLLSTLTREDLAIHAVDSRGWQAIHYAAQQGLVILVTSLLEHGADPESQDGKLKLTPLMIACQNGHSEVVKILLENGVQTSNIDMAHMTALHHSCIANAKECVELLIAQPGTMLDTHDINGCTALLYCLKNNNKQFEKLLINHGASLTAALDSGFSDLCYHTIQDNQNS